VRHAVSQRLGSLQAADNDLDERDWGFLIYCDVCAFGVYGCVRLYMTVDRGEHESIKSKGVGSVLSAQLLRIVHQQK
jgi:uncharacterized protein YuzB (UPF0349 family)